MAPLTSLIPPLSVNPLLTTRQSTSYKAITSTHATLHISQIAEKMGEFKKSIIIGGCCVFFVAIVIMSIALIATSLRKLASDEGRY